MTSLPRWTGLAGMLLIAAALVAMSYWGDVEHRTFVEKMLAEGHKTSAEVVSKTYEPEQYARLGGDYSVTVKYTDHWGKIVLAETIVSERFYESAKIGARLSFWYLDGEARDDRRWMLDPDFGLDGNGNVWALAVFLIACGAYTYMAARRRDSPQAALEREDRRKRRAEITAFKKRMVAKSKGEGPK